MKKRAFFLVFVILILFLGVVNAQESKEEKSIVRVFVETLLQLLGIGKNNVKENIDNSFTGIEVKRGDNLEVDEISNESNNTVNTARGNNINKINLINTKCSTNLDCIDNLFCNGKEVCNLTTNTCSYGIPACVYGEICLSNESRCILDENINLECETNDDCSNEEFCDGEEVCNFETKECEYGEVPCEYGMICLEGENDCLIRENEQGNTEVETDLDNASLDCDNIRENIESYYRAEISIEELAEILINASSEC